MAEVSTAASFIIALFCFVFREPRSNSDLLIKHRPYGPTEYIKPVMMLRL